MALQRTKERGAPARQVFPLIETVAGFGYAQNLMVLSDSYSTVVTGLVCIQMRRLGSLWAALILPAQIITIQI
jgi:hypothetical protein